MPLKHNDFLFSDQFTSIKPSPSSLVGEGRVGGCNRASMIRAVAISTRHRPFNTGAGVLNSRVIINIAPCWFGHCTEAKSTCNPLERKYMVHLPFFKGIAVIGNYCNNRYNKKDYYKYIYCFLLQA